VLASPLQIPLPAPALSRPRPEKTLSENRDPRHAPGRLAPKPAHSVCHRREIMIETPASQEINRHEIRCKEPGSKFRDLWRDRCRPGRDGSPTRWPGRPLGRLPRAARRASRRVGASQLIAVRLLGLDAHGGAEKWGTPAVRPYHLSTQAKI